ncbi:MAG TPA: hypothetical protein VHA80_15165 [Solirubrobacterales bacterium]|jgi:hypothetical protein|nr:hypothetical protein [Solirubrobacterales bacterium]
MRVFWDESRIDRLEQRMDRLERKVDYGFAAIRGEIKEVRGEARGDYRTLLGVQLTMLMAMILGFAGLVIQHYL